MKFQRNQISAKKEQEVFSSETENLLKKVAVETVCVESQQEKQFVSNIFLVKKKDGGNRSAINLKKSNEFIMHNHAQAMECMQSIKVTLKKDDFLCKLVLKGAYFCIWLSEDAKRYVKFDKKWQK